MNLRNVDLYKADLRNAILVDADLQGANLTDAYLAGANLQRTNLRDATLVGAYLGEADLEWANLRFANLRSADLTGARLYEANLVGAIADNLQFAQHPFAKHRALRSLCVFMSIFLAILLWSALFVGLAGRAQAACTVTHTITSENNGYVLKQ